MRKPRTMERAPTQALLLSDFAYHVYNRSNYPELLFKKAEDYRFFFDSYKAYLHPFVDTYAYCLIPNHFHLIIRVKLLEKLVNTVEQLPIYKQTKTQKDWLQIPEEERVANELLEHQFSRFFNSFAKKVNIKRERNTNLWNRSFKRLFIRNEAHYTHGIYYVNANAVKHKLVKSIVDYPHSSYHALISEKPTLLKREEVLNWYGGKEAFIKYHLQPPPWTGSEEFFLE